MVLTGALIVYSHRSWDAANRNANAASAQATLARQHLVSTVGAVVRANVHVEPTGRLHVGFSNLKPATAIGLEATIAGLHTKAQNAGEAYSNFRKLAPIGY